MQCLVRFNETEMTVILRMLVWISGSLWKNAHYKCLSSCRALLLSSPLQFSKFLIEIVHFVEFVKKNIHAKQLVSSDFICYMKESCLCKKK